MNKFEKVSYEKYFYCPQNAHQTCYNTKDEWTHLQLPKRGTCGSAGYDFFSPFDFSLSPGETIQFKTGIRVWLDNDKFLMLCPRSGLGFKYRVQLDNTVGIIDSDFVLSDNCGQISVKLTNDGKEGKNVVIRQGEAFMQGIILPYFKTDDDVADAIRNGGFGSTDKKRG